MLLLAQEKLHEEIARIMERFRIVGLAASVVKDGLPLWSGGYGLADLERQIPVTERTLFRVASISKTVCATAVMQLAERGLCGVDQDVGELLGFALRNPRFPDEPVTLRHLMTHTSGLQDEYVPFVAASRHENPPRLRLTDALLPEGAYYTERLWGACRPGDPEGYEYSNMGAVVLAAVVERVSQERFDEYCRRHIFDPLQMKETSFNIADAKDIGNVAVLYEYAAETGEYLPAADHYGGRKPEPIDYSGYVPGTNGALFSPQGGLRTSSAELSRFMRAHANRGELDGARILQPETADLMHDIHWSGDRRDGFFRYSGLQFHVTEDLIAGNRLIGHSGDAYGLLSGMYFHKQEQWGLIFLMNGLIQSKNGVFFDAEQQLADLFYSLLLQA